MQSELKQCDKETSRFIVNYKKVSLSGVTANTTVTVNYLFKEMASENRRRALKVRVGEERIMSRSIVLKDHKFSELQVIADGIVSGNYTFWNCRCSCGNVRVVEEKRLVSGTVTACLDCEAKLRAGKTVDDE